ncbi:hypothetical protein BV20DRAFT_456196 [Pilatotrama ljubarskyi]|nr:hypothetical protein BV20DRAFT_456196 [Pilatotrama ljubarskyi]
MRSIDTPAPFAQPLLPISVSDSEYSDADEPPPATMDAESRAEDFAQGSHSSAAHAALLAPRIRDIPVFPVTLSPPIRDLEVNRMFISETFGNDPRGMSVDFDDENRMEYDHDYLHCLFTKAIRNWTVPWQLGHPGVLFLPRPKVLWPKGTQKLVVGHRDGHWQYMDEYDLRATVILSPQEYCI